MASNYFGDDSSDNTDFDENDARAAITIATRRRYESVHETDQEGGRSNFTGFLNDDRPSMRSLLALHEGRNGLLVSDSRNDPNFTGDTRSLHTVNNGRERPQIVTAQTRSNGSNVGLPLTSTVKSGGVNFPNTHMESPIMNVRPNMKTGDPQAQNGWNRSRIGNTGSRNGTLEAQHRMNRIVDDRNENRIVDNKTPNNVSQ